MNVADFPGTIAEAFPEARAAKLMRGMVVVEKRARFRRRRVGQISAGQGPRPGDRRGCFGGGLRQDGMAATMEGAVRSGYLAAEAVLGIPGNFECLILRSGPHNCRHG